MIYAFLSAFWLTMVLNQGAMKLSAMWPAYKWPIFIIGTIIGSGGTWFIMALHEQRMNPNLVVGLCMGGGFVLSQLAMCALNRQFSPLQILGAAVTAAGIFLLAWAAPAEAGAR